MRWNLSECIVEMDFLFLFQHLISYKTSLQLGRACIYAYLLHFLQNYKVFSIVCENQSIKGGWESEKEKSWMVNDFSEIEEKKENWKFSVGFLIW